MNGYPLLERHTSLPSRSHTLISIVEATRKLLLFPLQAIWQIRRSSGTCSSARNGDKLTREGPISAIFCCLWIWEVSQMLTTPFASPVTNREADPSNPKAVYRCSPRGEEEEYEDSVAAWSNNPLESNVVGNIQVLSSHPRDLFWLSFCFDFFFFFFFLLL